MAFTDMYGENWDIPDKLTKKEKHDLIDSIQSIQYLYAKAGLKGIIPKKTETPKEIVNFVTKQRPFKDKTDAELAQFTAKTQIRLDVCVYEWKERGKKR